MIHIQHKTECCGCNACVQLCPRQCIAMQIDEEGFIYPQVNVSRCIDCGLCERVCPVLQQEEPRRPLSILASKNPNEQIRMKSSSGGIFTMLAEFVLERGGVVFGVRFDDHWDAVHDYTESIDGLEAFRRSKYTQSRIGGTFSQTTEFLKSGRWVLFSGTPCQIAGLTKFIGREYEKLLTVDLVCHGVPSPMIWKDYLRDIMRQRNVIIEKNTVQSSLNEMPTLSDISFRDKSTGWKKYSFVLRKSALEADQNSVLFSEIHPKNLFMRGFLKNLYLRPSCYACPARSGKSRSDITIADYWGITRWLPDFDDNKGIGLVLINTSKGAKIYASLGAKSIETSYEQALAGNPCIETDASIPEYKQLFWQKYRQQGISAIADICLKMHPSIWNRIAQKTKRFIQRASYRK